MGFAAASDRFQVLVLSSEESGGEIAAVLGAAGAGPVKVVAHEEGVLTELERGRVDLLVCDADAGWGAALALVRRVRAMASELHSLLPIVFFASDATVQQAVAARNAGVHRVIDKRTSGHLLTDELAGLLDHPPPFVRLGGYFGPTRMSFAPSLRPHSLTVATP